jgi:hypothetical protein
MMCEGPDEDGCTFWGAPQPCENEKICIGGSCGCEQPCEPGDTSCDLEGNLLSCQGPDADGCTNWGPGEPCPDHQGCRSGECVCENPCEWGEEVCYQSIGTRDCMGPDELDCMYWGELAACEPGYLCITEMSGCVKATPPECDNVNECDYEGQKLCVTQIKYRACKYSDDGCLIYDCSD